MGEFPAKWRAFENFQKFHPRKIRCLSHLPIFAGWIRVSSIWELPIIIYAHRQKKEATKYLPSNQTWQWKIHIPCLVPSLIFPFKNGKSTIYRWFIDDFRIQSFHLSWRISVKNMASRCWVSVHGVAHKLGGVAGSALDASALLQSTVAILEISEEKHDESVRISPANFARY